MPTTTRYNKKKNMKTRKIRKQFDNIEFALNRAEGKQTFSNAGENKFKQERLQNYWLHNLGQKKLQTMINKHYYKYDTKKVNFPVRKSPTTILYPTRKTIKRRRH